MLVGLAADRPGHYVLRGLRIRYTRRTARAMSARSAHAVALCVTDPGDQPGDCAAAVEGRQLRGPVAALGRRAALDADVAAAEPRVEADAVPVSTRTSAGTTSGSRCDPGQALQLGERLGALERRAGRRGRTVIARVGVGGGDDPGLDRDRLAGQPVAGSRCRPSARGGGGRRAPPPSGRRRAG